MAKYKSPIEIDILNGITMAMEDEVCKAVQRVDIKVDKRELIKALAYDRDQYNKGYKQGYDDCQKDMGIVHCSECVHMRKYEEYNRERDRFDLHLDCAIDGKYHNDDYFCASGKRKMKNGYYGD